MLGVNRAPMASLAPRRLRPPVSAVEEGHPLPGSPLIIEPIALRKVRDLAIGRTLEQLRLPQADRSGGEGEGQNQSSAAKWDGHASSPQPNPVVRIASFRVGGGPFAGRVLLRSRDRGSHVAADQEPGISSPSSQVEPAFRPGDGSRFKTRERSFCETGITLNVSDLVP